VRTPRTWQKYGASVALTLTVMAGRMALDPWWGRSHNRHLVFLPTILVVAWLCGLGPGIVSAVLFTGALGLYWREPGESVLRANTDLLLFAVVSAAICALIHSLHRAQRRANAATLAREQLLAIVAHDLRNPLTAITIAVAGLQLTPAEELSSRRNLKVIERSSLRMDHLIGDLVDATHIEQGDFVVERAPERLDGLLQEVIDLFTPQAEEHRITIAVASSPGDSVVFCDRNRIMQVLGNLIGNALKFTPADGRITVRTSERGETIRFEVEDTGAGIKPEHLAHIFERYWKSEPRGTGLGLFIAKSIVAAHGGELRVQSVPGRGALFSFELPRSGAQPAS
jgi:signal transduction histidine kinase